MTQEDDMTLDDKINNLIEVKKQIKDINDQLKGIKEREEEIARDLIRELEKAGLKRMANDSATISVVTENVPDVTDWDEFYRFISEQQAFELLHKRVSATAFRELSQTQDVPGVQTRELVKLNFRSQ
tara:strand:- start:39 stop:419 length:381 start_codon:yes stop_codon:yes gene_type:complete